ncbi:MAG: CopD family protein [Nitrospirae bacterium]|nr:CopD family protein [Nitrospirota bacterium]
MRLSFKAIVLLVFAVLFFPAYGFCTTEYASQTGKICSDCHIDPTGGGKLTKEGEVFRDNLRIRGQYRELNPAQRIVRFIVGYLHTITAIIWFGTILYVHIVLKPAYAAGGLPKGELRLGWASIVVMAVTGTLLSISRVPTWHMLFHTRFGILLSIKIVLFLIMVSTAVFVTFVVGPKLRKKREQGILQRAGDMTSDELSQYDGKDGRPAYIAFNGIIYDVTGSKLWREGSHFKKHPAGSDLTNILKTAPHGEGKVLGMPAAGKLLREKEIKKPPHIIIFYFFAYMNLVLIFSIVFIISLWRWW